MIYNHRYNGQVDRTTALAKIASLKNEIGESFTLIDVGGWAGSWVNEYHTHIVDIEKGDDPKVHYFTGNISNIGVWEEVLAYVKEHGKFDFCTCTHTLEDISGAMLACEMMSRISEKGYIAVPSKYAELRQHQENELSPWRGWYHHRWIYDVVDGRFVGYPKIPILEYSGEIDTWLKKNSQKGRVEFEFFWSHGIDLKVIMGDHLRPNSDVCMGQYLAGLLT